MIKKIWIPALILLLAWSAWASQDVGGTLGAEASAAVASDPAQAQLKDAAKTPVATGAVLLDLFIDNLREMTRQGTPDSLDKRLQEMMTAAKHSRETNTVDGVFFRRFNRMLAVTKLVAVPDSTGILAPVIEDVLSDFVQDMLGHSGFRESGGKGPKAINFVAMALREEIINLQLYLDTMREREALQKKFDQKMSAAPKKK
jgi:hypothetical protein